MKAFNHNNYKWSVEGLMQCIQDNKLKSEIIMYTKTAAIVHVKSYNDSIILGDESDWCICQHAESWNKYVAQNNNVQLFFYNFKVKRNNPAFLIGATYRFENSSSYLDCSFVAPNYPVRELGKYSCDEDALNDVLVRPCFGDVNVRQLVSTIKFNDAHQTSEERVKQTSPEPSWANSTPFFFPEYEDEWDVLDDYDDFYGRHLY